MFSDYLTDINQSESYRDYANLGRRLFMFDGVNANIALDGVILWHEDRPYIRGFNGVRQELTASAKKRAWPALLRWHKIRRAVAGADPMYGEWECSCGLVCNPSKNVDADFHWAGDHWQHHHEYPMGHVRMSPKKED